MNVNIIGVHENNNTCKYLNMLSKSAFISFINVSLININYEMSVTYRSMFECVL